MHAETDPRLGFQPDVYQRYGFLARLIEAVLGSAGDRNHRKTTVVGHRLLDVGSGPVRLVEAFLPTWVEVVRTDVTSFEDSSIVEIPSDGSLSFPDQSFDIVLAMDVLEHVPGGRRAGLLAECQRVAQRALIIGGPLYLAGGGCRRTGVCGARKDGLGSRARVPGRAQAIRASATRRHRRRDRRRRVACRDGRERTAGRVAVVQRDRLPLCQRCGRGRTQARHQHAHEQPRLLSPGKCIALPDVYLRLQQ